MTPIFAYPKNRHRRRERPSLFHDYQKYKPALRKEFGGRCIYCRIPDTLRGKDNFGVEHFKPKKRFPLDECRYANLYYACNTCNRRKGMFWPTQQQSRSGRHFLNPCDHEMGQHLEFASTNVSGKSKTGDFVVGRLQLNDPEAVTQRELITRLALGYDSDIDDCSKEVLECNTKILAARGNSIARADLVALRDAMQHLRAQLQSQQAALLGKD